MGKITKWEYENAQEIVWDYENQLENEKKAKKVQAKVLKPIEDEWVWKMEYCKRNGLAPANSEVWKKATEEYIEFLKITL